MMWSAAELLIKTKYMKRLIIILGIFCVLTSSCKQELEPPPAIDTSYFPLKVGDSLIYRYRVQRWVGFDETEQDSTYFYKEFIESYFLNAEQDTIFILKCYTRPDTLSDWRETGVNQYKRTPFRIYKTMDNITFEKMNFPVKEGKTWDANIWIDSVQYYEQAHYNDEVIRDLGIIGYVKSVKSKMSKCGQAYTLNGVYFPETVTVTLHDWTTVINNDNETEVYAKNIGLIYKKQYHLSSTGIYDPKKNPKNGFLKEWWFIENRHAYTLN